MHRDALNDAHNDAQNDAHDDAQNDAQNDAHKDAQDSTPQQFSRCAARETALFMIKKLVCKSHD